MKAVIKKINTVKGFYAADIDESGEYVIFELLDSAEPELEDDIEINGSHPLGGARIKNLTQNTEIEVFIQDYTDRAGAIKFLGNS